MKPITISEPLKWRRIKDAPPEHIGLEVIVGGGVKWLTSMRLGTQEPHRTHYILPSDLPPVPQEPEPRDLEREKFEAAWKLANADVEFTAGGIAERTAWLVWQAARKESK